MGGIWSMCPHTDVTINLHKIDSTHCRHCTVLAPITLSIQHHFTNALVGAFLEKNLRIYLCNIFATHGQMSHSAGVTLNGKKRWLSFGHEICPIVIMEIVREQYVNR